jgi:hypothetical protein
MHFDIYSIVVIILSLFFILHTNSSDMYYAYSNLHSFFYNIYFILATMFYLIYY